MCRTSYCHQRSSHRAGRWDSCGVVEGDSIASQLGWRRGYPIVVVLYSRDRLATLRRARFGDDDSDSWSLGTETTRQHLEFIGGSSVPHFAV